MSEVNGSKFCAFAQELSKFGPIIFWKTLTGVYYGETLTEVFQKIETDPLASNADGIVSIVVGICVTYNPVKKENSYETLATFPWSAIQTVTNADFEPSNDQTYFRFEIYFDEEVFLWRKVLVPNELIMKMADLANTVFFRDTKPGEQVYIFVLQRKEIA